ncbi:MAG TPA: SIS domain-containing protein [Bryobacteraceae bacterium]|nr:SIS domain-containing protein [Bryobacteraceae bacterium]
MPSSQNFSDAYRDTLIQTIQTIDAAKVSQAIEWFREVRDQGNAIFVAGNGGSAATASHFVCDMLKGASLGKPSRFRIQALHDSMPTLTAYANDLHYQYAAVEQLKNFASPGDIYMAISGSGNSPNVIRAMEFANSAGCRTLALTGRDGGKLGPLAQLNIQVPEQHMGRIEDAHHIICHMICYSFMDTE